MTIHPPTYRRQHLEREARGRATDAVNRDRDPAAWGRACPTCDEAYPEWAVHGLICDCERAKAVEWQARFVREQAPQVAEEILRESGIPRRFTVATFDSFERRSGTEEALARVQGWAKGFSLETDRGLILAGPFGSGKTHLAAAALRAAIERTLVEGRFLASGDLISQVRGGDSITWTPVDSAVRAELLVLDDVGQEAATDFERGVIARVILGRYDEARPTLFTSNLGPDRLKRALGGAVVSRLREMAQGVSLAAATDFRDRKSAG